jgi:glycosyltransferase involved in cell wall biosynthesis
LVEKIGYLIENEEERAIMGKNSRKLAEEEFDWEKRSEKQGLAGRTIISMLRLYTMTLKY